jgi:3',5'-cyclic AMP phosphodiesterase CpdA
LFLTLFIGCSETETIQDEPVKSFSFAFLTDMHVQPEKNATEGYLKAIEKVNELNPDFVITGGDLIMDALGQTYGRSDSLYKIYIEANKNYEMPVYNTMGNHEIFAIYGKSDVEKDHPEYGEKMYEQRLTSRYYSFDHEGWHFLILDSVEDTEEQSYIGMVDEEQMEWIREELSKLDKSTPIVISTHIPLMTIFMQKYYGALEPNSKGLLVNNAKEVLDLFKGYNLKLVLQGHLHTVEEIIVDGTHFITGGAVSGAWWSGPNRNYEEGFVMVKATGNEFEWEYIDYGWEVQEIADK